MPQTTPEQRDRWPGGDAEALAHLEQAGFVPVQFYWLKPTEAYKVTDRDADAINYLINEWDYGCIIARGSAKLAQLRGKP